MVRFLLERGLDVNARDHGGFTPLMAAALQGLLDIARILLKAGADVKARGSFALTENKTALQFARQVEDQQARKAMLELLTGKAAGKDPVERAFQDVQAFAEAAEKAAFQEVLELLGHVCGQGPRPWKKCRGVYACARPKVESLAERYSAKMQRHQAAVAGMEDEARAWCLVQCLRDEVYKKGAQLIGPEAVPSVRTVKLLRFPTTDPYAVLAACGTDGANYGLATQDIIAWLQEMAKKNPFRLTACGHDFVAGDFVGPVVGAARLAERMAEFCPDLLDGESIETPAQLAACLRRDQGFFFWWD